MDRKPLVLKPPQIPMFEWLRDHKRCALWAGMGIGKSSSALFTEEVLRMLGEVSGAPTLVLGPMRVARDTWPGEVAKWEQFSNVEIVPLIGTPRERVQLLQRYKNRAQYFTASYELAPWLVSHFMGKWPFKQVVADESDRLKGFRLKQGAMRAHAIARVAHTLVERWVNLTGTPAPESYTDLWGQTWYLDRGARLGRTFSAFTDRWFRPKWNGFGVELMPHSKKKIDELLRDICLTIDPKDYYDLHEPLVTQINVKLPEAARKVYKQLEKELFAQIGDEEIEVFNAAALTNKCLQLANGAVYTEAPAYVEIHNEKIEALESIQRESGGTPLLVAYQFRSDKERLLKAFKGSVDLSTREGMACFRAGSSPMGLAHPKSLGHGIDGLQDVTNLLVRFSRGWNHGEDIQMLERIGPMRQMQSGHDRVVRVYNICAEDTLDEDVITSHEAKRSVQESLLAAMKRKH
jgi:SNF2 family DNA or RNA helicase